jgi:hypothetical protein
MVNFETPDKIGFGIARGTACCLVSGDTIVDYSGHLLNLASRLMDLARPSGIVLDGAVDLELLDKETQGLFVAENVWIRGVAETEPTPIYVLNGVVEIPEDAKRPIRFESWEEESMTHRVSEWKAYPPRIMINIRNRLKRADGIIVELVYRVRKTGKPPEGLWIHHPLTVDAYSYTVLGNEPCVFVDRRLVADYAKRKKLRADEPVKIRILYVPM